MGEGDQGYHDSASKVGYRSLGSDLAGGRASGWARTCEGGVATSQGAASVDER